MHLFDIVAAEEVVGKRPRRPEIPEPRLSVARMLAPYLLVIKGHLHYFQSFHHNRASFSL